MPLPLINGRECIAALGRVGYVVVRSRGSHFRLECPGRVPVTVPMLKPIPRGTLRSILKTAGLAEEEFRALL